MCEFVGGNEIVDVFWNVWVNELILELNDIFMLVVDLEDYFRECVVLFIER